MIEMSFDWTPEELQQVVDENKIVIFMKGTPEEPLCGYSKGVIQFLEAIDSNLKRKLN